MNTLLACATCAKSFQDHTNAAGWSIFFMVLLILPVLAGVVFFMVRLARRSDAELEPEFRDTPPTVPSSH